MFVGGKTTHIGQIMENKVRSMFDKAQWVVGFKKMKTYISSEGFSWCSTVIIFLLEIAAWFRFLIVDRLFHVLDLLF